MYYKTHLNTDRQIDRQTDVIVHRQTIYPQNANECTKYQHCNSTQPQNIQCQHSGQEETAVKYRTKRVNQLLPLPEWRI